MEPIPEDLSWRPGTVPLPPAASSRPSERLNTSARSSGFEVARLVEDVPDGIRDYWDTPRLG
jgi:hypothetical protein